MGKHGRRGRKEARRSSDVLVWVLFALVMVFVAAVRIRLLTVPLERDEGEFAYAGQLILHGVAPYKLAYNMKFPGIYAAYAVLMAVFGQTIIGVHLGLMVVNLGAIALVFLLGKKLFGQPTGLAACASYALLTLSRPVLGSAAHATHFVVLFALGGLLVLLKAMEPPPVQAEPFDGAQDVLRAPTGTGRSRSFFWSGLLLGFAATMKQPGVFFVVFAMAYLLWRGLVSRRSKGSGWKEPRVPASRLVALLVGAAVPIAAVFVSAWATGVFDRFWFWTFTYGGRYASQVPRREWWASFLANTPRAIGSDWPVWVLAGIGVVAVLVDRAMRPRAAFVLGLLVLSACAVSVGFYLRNHYFVMMLPAVSLLAGCAVGSGLRVASRLRRRAAIQSAILVVFLAAIVYPIQAQSDYFFTMSPSELCARVYFGNPFVEVAELGNYVKAQASRDDRIAVLGSEPEMYFYSGLRSATGYIYTYGLMEDQPYAHRMQREMIQEIEAVKPKYLVVVVTPLSWCMTGASDRTIANWMENYSMHHYDVLAVADASDPGYPVYYWGKEAAERIDESPSSVILMRIRDR